MGGTEAGTAWEVGANTVVLGIEAEEVGTKTFPLARAAASSVATLAAIALRKAVVGLGGLTMGGTCTPA